MFCKDITDFVPVISNVIRSRITSSKKIMISPLPDELLSLVLSLFKNGLLLDFHHVYNCPRSHALPIYTIGEFIDMDDMYNNLERYKGTSKFNAWLRYKIINGHLGVNGVKTGFMLTSLFLLPPYAIYAVKRYIISNDSGSEASRDTG